MKEQNEAKVKYQLFAMLVNNASIAVCEKERFCRITPSYVLIYTKRKRVANAVKITESEIGRLTESDERWLWDCNSALLAEEVGRRTPEIIRDLSRKMERLEEELKAAKEREETGIGNAENEPCARTE